MNFRDFNPPLPSVQSPLLVCTCQDNCFFAGYTPENSFLQCCSREPSQSPACIADLNSQSPSLPNFLGSSLSKFLLVYSLIVDKDKISCIYKTLTQYVFFLTETCFVNSIHLMLLSIKNTFLQLSSLNWVYENITDSCFSIKKVNNKFSNYSFNINRTIQMLSIF